MEKIIFKVDANNVLTFNHPSSSLKLPVFTGDVDTSFDNNNYINFTVFKEN